MTEGNRRSKAITQWQVGGAEVKRWEKRPKMTGVGFVKSFVSRENDQFWAFSTCCFSLYANPRFHEGDNGSIKELNQA